MAVIQSGLAFAGLALAAAAAGAGCAAGAACTHTNFQFSWYFVVHFIGFFLASPIQFQKNSKRTMIVLATKRNYFSPL